MMVSPDREEYRLQQQKHYKGRDLLANRVEEGDLPTIPVHT